jgi:hypothetical protein
VDKNNLEFFSRLFSISFCYHIGDSHFEFLGKIQRRNTKRISKESEKFGPLPAQTSCQSSILIF